MTLGLAKVGLPAKWAIAAFFVGPLGAVVVSFLERRPTWRLIRQRSAGRMDWGFAATAAGVGAASFLGALWWPQSTVFLAQKGRPHVANPIASAVDAGLVFLPGDQRPRRRHASM